MSVSVTLVGYQVTEVGAEDLHFNCDCSGVIEIPIFLCYLVWSVYCTNMGNLTLCYHDLIRLLLPACIIPPKAIR